MKTLIRLTVIGLCSVSSLSFASHQNTQEIRIDHFGTGSDGDNTSGLLLKEPIKLVPYLKLDQNKEPRIEHYGTGNDGDNTAGLLLVDHEKYYAANTSTVQVDTGRIDHYGTGNDGDNTTGLLLKD